MDIGTPPDNHTPIIIGIAIFIVLALFMIVVVIGWFLSDQPSNNLATITEIGTFLSPCTTTLCAEGLACDPTTFICKLSTGATCTDFTDCVTGLICSGLCSTGATGGLNQLCPCGTGFICTQQLTGFRVCKGAGGTPCQSSFDCVSGLCQTNGICAAGSPNSFPCTMNIQCASGNCNNRFCQASGVISGTLGAACSGECVPFAGAGCSGTIAQPLNCECVAGTGVPGICINATQGVISACSISRACSNQLVCYNVDATECISGETGCICTFPYEDPNTQATGTVCIVGMASRGSLQRCFNNGGLGCDSGGMCVNSACGGPPVLAAYRFSMSNTPNLRTEFVGATTTSILAGATGLTGTIQPHKLFATSGFNIDTIYLVDNLQGLLSIVFDPITFTVLTPWTLVIPHTTTTTTGTITSTRTLIDAGYNGMNFIVAFDEVLTGGATGQNDTVYIGTSLTSLTPFNFQPGSGITGTQYSTAGTPLSIEYIDISPRNDASLGNDVLIAFNGTINVKESTQALYSVGVIQGGPMHGLPMTGLTGPARFYFDLIQNAGGTGPPVCPKIGPADNPIRCPSAFNIAFVGPFTGFGGGVYDQVLQFSGNIAGIAEPIDRFEETPSHVQYRVFDYSIYSQSPGGMLDAGVIMLTSAFQGGNFIDNVVAASHGGNTTPLPYRISPTSRSVATANALYVLSIASCS